MVRQKSLRAAIFLLALVLGPAIIGALGASHVSEPELEPGDIAPDFTLPGSDGKVYRLSALRGTVVVIAWFPKAFTGG